MYKQRCRLRKWTVQLGGGHRSIVSYAFERATAVHNAVAFVLLHFVALVCRFHSCCAPFSTSAHHWSAPPRARTLHRPARALLATLTKARNEHETTCPTARRRRTIHGSTMDVKSALRRASLVSVPVRNTCMTQATQSSPSGHRDVTAECRKCTKGIALTPSN